jgi:hypothetical protein
MREKTEELRSGSEAFDGIEPGVPRPAPPANAPLRDPDLSHGPGGQVGKRVTGDKT